MSDGSTLQSVTNALRVLEAFSETDPELGVAELSRILGLGKSTVFRLITTLEARGYLSQNPVTGKYRLGLTAVRLGRLVLSQISLVRDSQPFLEELTHRAEEASHLAVLQGGRSTYIGKVDSPRAIRMGASVGAHLPAYCTGTGKVLLANLPVAELEEYLRETQFTRYTAATIIDPDELRAHLAQIRVQGYSVDQEEFEEGLLSIAAPVRDSQGRVVAAMSTSGPSVRLQKRLDELKNLVMASANGLSRALGWNPEAG